MNKICTSIEQSKKLIELGVDVNTADMCYRPIMDIDTMDFTKYLDIPDAIPFKEIKNSKVPMLPAWSLAALLSMIKPINDNSYTLIGTLDGGAIISFEEVTNVMFQEEEIIDAVFEMIVWLKGIKKI